MIPWGIKLGTVALTLAIGAAISPPAQDRSRLLELHSSTWRAAPRR